jgi:hypothetical protein
VDERLRVKDWRKKDAMIGRTGRGSW